MSDSDEHGHGQTARGALRPQGGTSTRRPRTTYLWYRRYHQFGRLALLLGGLFGLLVSGYALVPLLLAGEPVPRSSFLVAISLVAVSALLPYLLVRWRWHALRKQLAED